MRTGLAGAGSSGAGAESPDARPRRGSGIAIPEGLVGRGRIELPQSKTRVLQTLGLTTCPTDPRGDSSRRAVGPGAASGG